MKNLATAAAFLGGFLIVYLLGAFYVWNINAGQWTEFTRFTVALIGAFVGLIFACIHREIA